MIGRYIAMRKAGDGMTDFVMGSTMRVFRPHPNIVAFYDGRIAGVRAHSPKPNWLDDGAFTLGCCSFAIVDGDEALVYDTQMSIAHARIIRRSLTDIGIKTMRVILSHWHVDHIAGNEVFADCEIIANRLTTKAMADNLGYLENNDPPIRPVVMPTTSFDGEARLMVGSVEVIARHLDIHSHDGTVLLLPKSSVLLAGDTLEDTVTYVVEPEHLDRHLADLDRMASWAFERILPNHGSQEMIVSGGYGREFIAATKLYIQKLQRLADEPGLADLSFLDFAAESLATGGVAYFEAYEPVHRHNAAAVLALTQPQRLQA